jgi:hypothetical protein
MNRKRGLIAIAASLLVLAVLVFAYPQRMIAPGAVIPAHAGIAGDCFACHAPLRGASSARCATCHKPGEIGVLTTKGTAIRLGKPRPAFHQALTEQNCMACHSDHAGPKLTRRPAKAFAHHLLQPALQGKCESCHAAPVTPVHQSITAGCSQCHKVAGWKPTTFAHDRYFKLDGDHDAACTTCHVGGDFKRFTCYGCHEHQPEPIRVLHAEEGIRNIENCVGCHRSSKGESHGGGEGPEGAADD